VDFRTFGGDEGLSYGTVDLNYGLDKGLAILLRSTFSDTTTFFGPGFSIEHGGVDGEALLKYADPQCPHLALLAGAAAANTPAHRDVFAVGEAVYQYPFQALTVYGNAKILTGSDTTVFAIGLGASYNLGSGFEVIGDLSWPLTGDPTYSTSTGSSERDVLFGAAVRYFVPGITPGQLSVDAGLTNALGGSTGFGLTPSLGSSVGLFVAATYRF
jgi:hypothetical protein